MAYIEKPFGRPIAGYPSNGFSPKLKDLTRPYYFSRRGIKID